MLYLFDREKGGGNLYKHLWAGQTLAQKYKVSGEFEPCHSWPTPFKAVSPNLYKGSPTDLSFPAQLQKEMAVPVSSFPVPLAGKY